MTYLCEKGIPPEAILALTFTKKTAEEMRIRVKKEMRRTPHITTFHALCYELLYGPADSAPLNSTLHMVKGGSNHRTEGQNRQASHSVTFITEPQRIALIARLRKTADLKALTTRELGLHISRAKNLPIGEMIADEAIAKLVTTYNHALNEQGVSDFDDLLRHAHAKLSKGHALPYRYILVDEFQDTNVLQYQLLQLLRTNDNVCVIGDPLQSIYGFRGASSDIFERFKTDFPAHQQIALTTNYRSVPEVVALSNALFTNEPNLQAAARQAGTVRTVQVLNEYSEAQWIITQIEQQLGGTDFLRSHNVGQSDLHCQFQDFAVLYRTHYGAKTVQRAFAQSGLPYQVVGEGSPYDQPEVAAIVAALRSLLQDAPPEPPKGFSQAQWQTQLEVLQSSATLPLSKLAAAIATAAGLPITQDLRQFMNSLLRFDALGAAAFLEHVEAIAEQGFYDPQANAVTLLTIHAAKGLEFRHVFIIGAEETQLPSRSSLNEEKRLFYVAVTRAKEKLDIMHTKTRAGRPSALLQFAAAIPETILPRYSDPEMTQQARQLGKRRAKRAQTSLF